jgi:2'-5' RNA ligase
MFAGGEAMRTDEHQQGSHNNLSQPASIFYWLTPAPAEYTVCQAWIESLGEMFGGPKFAPHVTLYAGPLAPAEDPERLLERVAEDVSTAGNGPLRLRATGLHFSDSFTKCCYIQFEPDGAATALAEQVKSLTSASAEYHFNPHLSLFYGHLTEPQRERIRELIQLPEEMSFDQLCAITSGPQVRTRGDVEAWLLVAVRPLNGIAPFSPSAR